MPNNDAQAIKIVFQAERYFLIDGSLHHLHLPRNKRLQLMDLVSSQLVVPRELRELLLQQYHEKYCHIGPDKMYNTIRNKYFWQNMYVDVFNWARACAECQMGKDLP